jgi:hypothetical protein
MKLGYLMEYSEQISLSKPFQNIWDSERQVRHKRPIRHLGEIMEPYDMTMAACTVVKYGA